MKELSSPVWIKFKGLLFLFSGILAAALLVADDPRLKTALLLGLAIWCFCRFYYFAFYVIEHYVDEGFKFSGLWSFAVYLCSNRRRRP